MAILNQWLANHLFIFVFIVSIANLVFLGIIAKKQTKLHDLLRSSEGKDLEALLIDLAEKINQSNHELQKLTEDYTKSKVLAEKYIQKLGLIRFKAFENQGGDQSFALALLDSLGNGFVLSSIFGREESRAYCKPIEGGVSNYPLSEEEKEAIHRALGISKK